MSSFIGSAVGGDNPEDHGKYARNAKNIAADAAASASRQLGRAVTPDAVLQLVQSALVSAQAGFDSFCKQNSLDTESLMSHLKSCSRAYQRSFYISVLNKVPHRAIAELENARRLGNRP